MRNAQANDQPPKSRGIRNKTLLSLPQEYSRNRPNRLTNQKYVLSGFVIERLPPQIGDGRFLQLCHSRTACRLHGNLALTEGFLKCLSSSAGNLR